MSFLTAFVVARAGESSSPAWLFSKNEWGPLWSGYGIALSGDGQRPWPHLGLETGAHGYFQFSGELAAGLRIVEVICDGQSVKGLLEGNPDREQACRGSILKNSQPLTIGTLGNQFLEGDIAEILIYRRALSNQDREQTRRYLMLKYSLPGNVAQSGQSSLVSDWLFQTEGRPLLERTAQEIRWTRELVSRLARDPRPLNLRGDLAELEGLAAQLAAVTNSASGPKAARELYLAVRRVKRSIMFKNSAVDFTQLLFIDQPLPQGSESTHEAVHRLGMMAVPGGRLLLLNGLGPEGQVRSLLPEKVGSFWRPDLSFDARKVLFCFKPKDEKSFHLYEMNLDGTARRQLTDGDYDDIDPI